MEEDKKVAATVPTPVDNNLQSHQQSLKDRIMASIMNSTDDEDVGDKDICRVCRLSGEGALYHPCLCTGNIKYLHQDCRLQWLEYSKKDVCELCNHKFSFRPLYRISNVEKARKTTMKTKLKNIAIGERLKNGRESKKFVTSPISNEIANETEDIKMDHSVVEETDEEEIAEETEQIKLANKISISKNVPTVRHNKAVYPTGPMQLQGNPAVDRFLEQGPSTSAAAGIPPNPRPTSNGPIQSANSAAPSNTVLQNQSNWPPQPPSVGNSQTKSMRDVPANANNNGMGGGHFQQSNSSLLRPSFSTRPNQSMHGESVADWQLMDHVSALSALASRMHLHFEIRGDEGSVIFRNGSPMILVLSECNVQIRVSKHSNGYIHSERYYDKVDWEMFHQALIGIVFQTFVDGE